MLPPPSATPSASVYEDLADDLVRAFDERDAAALARVNAMYERRFTPADLDAEVWRRVYAYRQRSHGGAPRYLLVDEARLIVAQDVGFNSWPALLGAISSGAPPVPPFEMDAAERRLTPRRYLGAAEWDAFFERASAERVACLDGGGLVTDTVLARIARLNHLTALSLTGSRLITDEGLQHLADMPQLETLDLTGVPVSDRGLEVLVRLPNLRRFTMTWSRTVSDAGLARLAACDRLEEVDVMGAACGDGVIAALESKPQLRVLKTGQLVTDTGVARLRNFPVFAHGADGELLLDGPFTDAGLAQLAGLTGIASLDLFWHVQNVTPHGFAALAQLPNLTYLGADGALSSDESFTHIGRLPRLRRLRAQEAVATDSGFAALAESPTLEEFWGRECEGFGSRAFRAFSRMPRLRTLGVSCQHVDDAVLAMFADFPSLESLTPIGMRDSGFRHIGRCASITRLTCMYCRETTDEATAHVARLPLRYYYAGLTQITDRSLEILGHMPTLEQAEFYETTGLTDAGLHWLAALPNLREVAFDSLPGVTLAGTRVFPSHVRVRYTT
jgi:hypothetical protein